MNKYNLDAKQKRLKRAKAYAVLRKQGKTWDEIGAMFNISKQAAQKVMRK